MTPTLENFQRATDIVVRLKKQRFAFMDKTQKAYTEALKAAYAEAYPKIKDSKGRTKLDIAMQKDPTIKDKLFKTWEAYGTSVVNAQDVRIKRMEAIKDHLGEAVPIAPSETVWSVFETTSTYRYSTQTNAMGYAKNTATMASKQLIAKGFQAHVQYDAGNKASYREPQFHVWVNTTPIEAAARVDDCCADVSSGYLWEINHGLPAHGAPTRFTKR